MRTLAEMNQAAELVVARGELDEEFRPPFAAPRTTPDTMLYKPQLQAEDRVFPFYEAAHTAAEGIVINRNEFELAFFADTRTYPSSYQYKLLRQALEAPDHQKSTPLAQYSAVIQKIRIGTITGEPFLSIRRTPQHFVNGQSARMPIALTSYVGTLWAPVKYSAHEGASPETNSLPRSADEHVALFTISRPEGLETVTVHALQPFLALGHEAVERVVSKQQPLTAIGRQALELLAA